MNSTLKENISDIRVTHNTKNSIKEIAAFIFVGTSNTLLEIGTMNLLWWLTGIYSGNINYLFKTITFLICSTVSYFLNQKVTFRSKSGLKDYLKYAAVLGCLSLIEAVIISEFTKISVSFVSIEAWANIISIIASFLTGILNFFISKFIIFNKK